MMTAPIVVARQLHITGVVQGVGFRPFVHRLAIRYGLAGWVRNIGGEVEITVEGEPEKVEEFTLALTSEAPTLARVERVEVTALPPEARRGFVIERSADVAGHRQPVSPDAALCAACEAELFDPTNRRFGYPFITCTDCGPRFTVIETMPYDRERTSMRPFRQCPACAAEYAEPGNRRYHSETNSCPTCGPRLWLERPDAGVVSADSQTVLSQAANLLRDHGILAIRGLGGFHLAVDATSSRAVLRLRDRKHRNSKPFAVMVPTLADAQALAHISDEEAAELTSSARPVVLLRRYPACGLATGIAPGLDTIGILLPSTPLHLLLLEAVGCPLVMTSGNLSDEPIATGNDEAKQRLAGVADGFLFHDREIVARYDDSVVRVVHGAPIFLRRARGFAPLPLTLPLKSPEALIAVGPDLKNTFTLVEGDRAYVSQHIGDLDGFETQQHFAASLQRFRTLFQIAPTVAVRDLHPGYHSTRIAIDLGLERTIAVQHHHAHIASVLAEHAEPGPVVGIAYDGTGYGEDGEIWGAEILLADLGSYRRLGHLRYAPLPGGDLATRQPWRTALGYLSLAPEHETAFDLAFRGVDASERAVAALQVARRLNPPLASSMGRLFDAASAVLGIRRKVQHEGQGAMELEALAGRLPGKFIPIPMHDSSDGQFLMDPVPLLAELGRQRQAGGDPEDLAATFHASIIEATVQAALRACELTGVHIVALGGGVFQNARLSALIPPQLEAHGLRVLMPRLLSPNDGGISYGQAAVAATILAREAAQSRSTGGSH
jgi:hydrogenase maturation protein HypF